MTSKTYSLFTALFVSFIDVAGIGLAYPIFSSIIFGAENPILSPNTPQAMRGILLGFILAIPAAAQFLSSPFLGTLSDSIGRKKVLVASTTLGSIGYLIAFIGVWHNQIYLLALAQAIVGTAAGNKGVASAIITDLSTPQTKVKNFGLLHMINGLGTVAGPLLGSVLLLLPMDITLSYAAPFACAAILNFINVTLIIFFFKETHSHGLQHNNIFFEVKNFSITKHVQTFFFFFATIFIYCFGWSFYWNFISVTWVVEYNLNFTTVYKLYALGALCYGLSAGLVTKYVAAKFTLEKIFFFALIGCAIFILVPLALPSPITYYFCIPFQQICMALIFPAAATLISNKVSPQIQGKILGIQESIQALAGVIGPLIAGFLITYSIKMPLIIGASSLLLAAQVLYYSDKKYFLYPSHKHLQ